MGETWVRLSCVELALVELDGQILILGLPRQTEPWDSVPDLQETSNGSPNLTRTSRAKTIAPRPEFSENFDRLRDTRQEFGPVIEFMPTTGAGLGRRHLCRLNETTLARPEPRQRSYVFLRVLDRLLQHAADFAEFGAEALPRFVKTVTSATAINEAISAYSIAGVARLVPTNALERLDHILLLLQKMKSIRPCLAPPFGMEGDYRCARSLKLFDPLKSGDSRMHWRLVKQRLIMVSKRRTCFQVSSERRKRSSKSK